MKLYVDIEKKLEDFNLKVNFETDCEIFALLGSSGCGKTMTLKCIAGIEKPDKGVIRLGERVLFDSEAGINLPVRKRRVGYLFQDYALFPHMTVMENIACGGSRRAEEYIKKFYLSGKENMYPDRLSGGEKQRTAIARMLAASPDLIMFDEPLSAVDSYLKSELEAEILTAAEELGGQALIVSHDMGEIYRMAERIAVMGSGEISGIQDKKDLFERPNSVAAARLTGCENISLVKADAKGNYVAEDWGITVRPPQGQSCRYAALKSEDIKVFVENPKCGNDFIKVRPEMVIEDMNGLIIRFKSLAGRMMTARIEERREAVNNEIYIEIPHEKIMFFDR